MCVEGEWKEGNSNGSQNSHIDRESFREANAEGALSRKPTKWFLAWGGLLVGVVTIRVNPPEDARLTFNAVVNDRLQDMIDSNFKFYKQVTDNPEFAEDFLGWLFDRYRRSKSQPTGDQPG